MFADLYINFLLCHGTVGPAPDILDFSQASFIYLFVVHFIMTSVTVPYVFVCVIFVGRFENSGDDF